MREDTESVDLTEEESNERKEVLHSAAVKALGAKTNANTIAQKMEELEFLKQQLFGHELDSVVQKFGFKIEVFEQRIFDRLDDLNKTLEGKIEKLNQKSSLFAQLQETIEEINKNHNKFVKHLQTVLEQMETKITKLKTTDFNRQQTATA